MNKKLLAVAIIFGVTTLVRSLRKTKEIGPCSQEREYQLERRRDNGQV